MKKNPHIQEDDLRNLHQDAVQWAMYCTGYDRELAREVVQQTYLKVVDGSARYSKKSALKTWLFGVIRLTSLECRRKQQLHAVRTRELDELESQEAPAGVEAHYGEYSGAYLEQALAALSRGQREIIYLAFYREHTLTEIAEITGAGIGSVRTQYHRAKLKLARELQAGECYEEDPASCS